ncbi:molybdopterin molybdotransferase MoeA [Endozoicomonas numazuensis]|uniref:Molybdopterin molybdenumtransferase n=1 Tax=Endozoicomonas numazuensis TaxID=1137799 RepID=A0A081NEV3_9GAMM|nr:molybdopterin molybdotransferase MoeA [Endozoicomonas numazuensis]KEQ16976.1 molybdopterin molybdenumtransferase [Endozoicomonas numazuensis]
MTDCCAAPGLMPLHEGLEKLVTETPVVTESESVALEDCLDRVLSDDIISPVNVPSHDNSAMDGYAFQFSDLKHHSILPLAGQSLAGHPYQGTMPSGHCIRIMTGASIPEGTDTVIMQEQTEPSDQGITFTKKPSKPGNNVRRAGEDIAEGCQVFRKGHVIKAQDIGLLASLGVAKVPVVRKIKVALFSTGDELKLPGETLGHGDIYDSNRFAVSAMLKRLGTEVIDLGKIRDDRSAIREAFLEADQRADAVITSGGVSVGDADFVKDILNEIGHTSFWKLAIKPGKPFAFGKLPNSVFFGLPGNPVSATVTFQQLAAPALHHMMGAKRPPAIELPATCCTPLKKQPGRLEFQRGILSTNERGEAEVVTTGSQGSGILRSMSMANCYIVLPASQGNVEAGETVKVQMFDKPLM